MKKVMKGVLALALLLGFGVREAGAANPDTLTITITPTVTLDVTISTSVVLWSVDGGADLDISLTLGTTDFLVRPGTVTLSTTFADTELNVDGIDNMADWAFDTDPLTAEADGLQVYVLFSSNTQQTGPAIADFDDGIGVTGDMVDDLSTRRYGLSGSDDGLNDSQFQSVTFAEATENMQDTGERHIWVRVDMPPATSSTNPQTFSIALTAVTLN